MYIYALLEKMYILMCGGKKRLNIALKLTCSRFLSINCATQTIHMDVLRLYIGIDITKHIWGMLELNP